MPLVAHTQENVSLDGYTCEQFLADTKEPANGQKLLKSLMMISWSTGYAAAFQKGVPRADARGIRLIAATLGDACRKQPDQIAIRVISNAINKFVSAEPSAPPQAAPGASRWDQGGSIVSLVADGADRQFIYDVPTAKLLALGIRKGSLLFVGKKNGNSYAGAAYSYAPPCEPKKFQVKGEIADDEKQVVLRGRAPELGTGCKAVGYRDEVLLFKFLPSEPN